MLLNSVLSMEGGRNYKENQLYVYVSFFGFITRNNFAITSWYLLLLQTAKSEKFQNLNFFTPKSTPPTFLDFFGRVTSRNEVLNLLCRSGCFNPEDYFAAIKMLRIT